MLVPIPQRGPRRGALLPALVAVALLFGGIAPAHGDAGPHALAGVALCLDPSSLRVAVDGLSTPGRTEAFLRARLEEGVDMAVERFHLPLERRDACPANARLVLTLDARAAAPGVVDYVLALLVTADEAAAGEAPRFVLRLASRYDEALTATPYLVSLPRYGAAMMNDLALSWWEDNAQVRTPARRWLPRLLGGTLTFAILLGGVWWRLLRSRPPSRGSGNPYDGS